MQSFFMLNARLLVFAVLCGIMVLGNDHNWSYEHQDKWPGMCLIGHKQSPINLQKSTSEYHVFTDFHFQHYDYKYYAKLTNNGHSIAIKLVDSGPMPSIKGGGLPHKYILDHLHFHWESEHTLHGNRYPLELHLVHYANIYNSTEEAMKHENGLAVIAVLFDFYKENPVFYPILDKLPEIEEVGEEVKLQDSIFLSNFLPKNTDTFFRYEGSLTTPTCDETVVWTVFYQTNYISKYQFIDFTTNSEEGEPLQPNYRNLQNLNSRVVVLGTADLWF